MKTVHMMIDLETLGTANNAAITQIGWCFFDEDSVFDEQTFFVDAQTCLDAGLTATWESIKWWMQQSQEARDAACNGGEIDIADALMGLEFAVKAECHILMGIWANPSGFDIPILESAYRATGARVPWNHRLPKDFRTLWLASKLPKEEKATPTLAHHAGADAVAQALSAQKAMKVLGMF